MSEAFISEIRMMSFGFAPRGWATCDGQLLPIAQNQALFSLLGTTFGGDGITTFALPELRGRVPIHFSDDAIPLGQRGGEEQHTLSVAETPQHTHTVQASTNPGDAPTAVNHVLATSSTPIYGNLTNLVNMAGATITPAGGSQPHSNLQPSLVINFCIALAGIFPSRT